MEKSERKAVASSEATRQSGAFGASLLRPPTVFLCNRGGENEVKAVKSTYSDRVKKTASTQSCNRFDTLLCVVFGKGRNGVSRQNEKTEKTSKQIGTECESTLPSGNREEKDRENE